MFCFQKLMVEKIKAVFVISDKSLVTSEIGLIIGR